MRCFLAVSDPRWQLDSNGSQLRCLLEEPAMTPASSKVSSDPLPTHPAHTRVDTNSHKVRPEPRASSLRGFSGSDSPESGHPPGREPRLFSQGTSKFLLGTSLSPKMPKRHQSGTGSCSLETTRNM